MKYLIIILSILLISCRGYPVLNDPENPFVVDKELSFNDGYTIYTTKYNTGEYLNNIADIKIVLKGDFYNVGDTIYINFEDETKTKRK